MNDSGDIEIKIVNLIKEGDASVPKVLYCAYAGYLTGVCARYLSVPDYVKDVLHDSFLKIFSSVAKFEYRGKGSLKAWITRIVVNESVKFVRKEYGHQLLSELPENFDIAIDEPDIDGMSMDVLHGMICELPAGYRTIFNLYVIEGWSHKEIAEELNIKESTSASQFHRAKAMLAKKIRRYQHYNNSIEYER